MSPVNSYCKVEYVMTEAYKVHNTPAVVSLTTLGEARKGGNTWVHSGSKKNEHYLPSPGHVWLLEVSKDSILYRISWVKLTLSLDFGDSFCNHYKTITQFAVWLECTV